jgi:hypothetical protein
VVQIFDQDDRKLIATLIAIPTYRDLNSRNVNPETAIKFEERLSSEPEAVKIWFRPWDEYGMEFMYSKNQSQLLAKNSPWAIPGTVTPEVAQNEMPAASTPAVTEPTVTTTPADTDNSSAVTPSTDTGNDEDKAAPSPMADETPDAGLPPDADQAQPPVSSSDTPNFHVKRQA